MPSATEAALYGSALNAQLIAGIQALGEQQSVVFSQYAKSTIPTDGFVFWVATGMQLETTGVLHYSTDRTQDEDETIGINQVIFSVDEEITEFNAIAPNTVWVANYPVPDGEEGIQIAFSRRGSYFRRADVWHYVGIAVKPVFSAQLVNSLDDLPAGPIVSNSLPIWLSQNSFAPVYASFLVPDNVVPPYIAAHIVPAETTALQAFPFYQWPGVTEAGSPAPFHQLPSQQLMQDHVRLTLYGFNNQAAIQYLCSLIDYSLATDNFGFCNSPAIQDDKRTQVEIAVLAQRKTIDILASYYQSAADAVARRLILSAAVSTAVNVPTPA